MNGLRHFKHKFPLHMMHSGNMPVGGFHRAVHSLLYGMIAGIGGLRGSSFFHVEQNVFRNIQRRIFFREGFIYGDCQKKEK